jgi:hypothetical protein
MNIELGIFGFVLTIIGLVLLLSAELSLKMYGYLPWLIVGLIIVGLIITFVAIFIGEE